MAMRWFDRSERKEVWDEAIEWPIGDIEAAQKIRVICHSAAGSAEKVGAFDGRAGTKHQREHERYERAARMAMEIAMKVSDELLRDASVRQIVDLCMKANNTKTAQTLFRAIQAKSIRNEVLRDHPTLQGDA
jgi:hypothetical protein